MEITREDAKRVLEIVKKGLRQGPGRNPVEGQICVEQAVCLALGLPHSDKPICVSRAVRALKVRLNDSAWSSNQARAEGLKELSIAQLGTDKNFNDVMFVQKCVDYIKRNCADCNAHAAAATAAADGHAAYAAYAGHAAYAASHVAYAAGAHAAAAAADAAADATYDKTLSKHCKAFVQILIEMNAYGTRFLDLTV